MKVFESEIYGNCPQPETFNELVELITNLETDDHDTNRRFVPVRMWRGQSQIAWKIDSSALRRIQIRRDFKDTERELRFYEERLLKHATHKGFRIQDGRELSDLELLAKLQHHGAATRLVDFSRNAFIGLWFATNYDPEKTGILIGIHAHYIGGQESRLEEGNYKEIIDKCSKYEHPQVFESPSVSPRIASQHAQFLYSKVSSAKTGTLQIPKKPEANIFIAISPKFKKVCLEIMESAFDFRTKTLFPDLDGFGLANRFDVDTYSMDRW